MHKLWHIYLNAFAAKGHLQNGNIFSLNYIIRIFFFKFGAMFLASRKVATQIEIASFSISFWQFVWA